MSYLGYATGNLDRSGVAHVNLFSGGLVYTHTDLSMTGNRMPITITHIFNSVNRNDNDSKMLYGNGWRTNYDQRVSKVKIGNTDYYKYTDADATIHYFSLQSSVWKDESGLGMKMTFSGNVPTITDKQGNKMVFYAYDDANKPGFLNYIQDHNNNKLTVGYDSNNRIYQLTDGARATDGTGGRVVTLNRNTDGSLNYISDPSGRHTTFQYISNRLHQITYPDNSYTIFHYDSTSGNLNSATGFDNRKLNFTYTASSPYQVLTMSESATVDGNTTYGNALTFAYSNNGNNRTSMTDEQNRTNIYEFNNYGNTV